MNLITSKKALVYYGGFLSSSGGAFMHAIILKEALVNDDWTVAVHTLDSLPIWAKYIPHVALKVFNAFLPPSGFIIKGRIISLLFRLLIPPVDSDLVVFEDAYSAWAVDQPSVVILHAVWSDNLEGKSISNANYHRLVEEESKVLCSLKSPVATVSENYREYIVSNHFSGLPLPLIHCIPLGVDIDHIISFKRHEEERNPFGLVFTGACIERKNIPLLFDILGLLVEDGKPWSLTIIGDGPLFKSLKSSAFALALPVHFTGRLRRNELLSELSKHSIYVHPSTKESFSFSLLEAKLLGLKTIAHYGLEVPPDFIDNKTHSFSPLEWESSIRSALDDDTSDENLSQFSSSLMADALIQIANSNQSQNGDLF